MGYLIARNKKAMREWQRHRKGSAKRGGVGLTGQALDRAMAGVLMLHPEFQKGVPRPRHLQPRSMWAAEAALKRQAKAKLALTTRGEV